MLRHTFCHIPGVGERTEQRLWAEGITSWGALLGRPPRGAGARALKPDRLRESIAHYESRNCAWFGRALPPGQVWRLFHDFREGCAFLDIETTGLLGYGHVTTVALYDGRTIRHYVHGVNLDDFVRDVAAYPLLVTYNGKSFDVPYLERCLPVRLDQAHIDLRHVLKSLGLVGGLKSCERQLGIHRPGLEEVDGYVAVLLWHDYQRRRDPRTLESLLAYNVQDAVNLETLMVHAFNRKLDLLGAAFAADYRLPLPAPAANPFRADPDVLRRVVGGYPLPRPFRG